MSGQIYNDRQGLWIPAFAGTTVFVLHIRVERLSVEALEVTSSFERDVRLPQMFGFIA